MSNYGSVFWRKVAIDFARTFVGGFVVSLPLLWTALDEEDWVGAKAAAVSGVYAGASAVVRGLQARFTNLETPVE